MPPVCFKITGGPVLNIKVPALKQYKSLHSDLIDTLNNVLNIPFKLQKEHLLLEMELILQDSLNIVARCGKYNI